MHPEIRQSVAPSMDRSLNPIYGSVIFHFPEEPDDYMVLRDVKPRFLLGGPRAHLSY